MDDAKNTDCPKTEATVLGVLSGITNCLDAVYGRLLTMNERISGKAPCSPAEICPTTITGTIDYLNSLSTKISNELYNIEASLGSIKKSDPRKIGERRVADGYRHADIIDNSADENESQKIQLLKGLAKFLGVPY